MIRYSKSRGLRRTISICISMIMAFAMLYIPETKVDAASVEVNYAKLLQESLYFYDANMCGPKVSERSAFSWRGNCHAGDVSVN